MILKKSLYFAVAALCVSLACTACGSEPKSDKVPKQETKTTAVAAANDKTAGEKTAANDKTAGDKSANAKSAGEQPAAEKAKPAAPKPEDFADKPYVVAKEDLSNLQLDDPTKPVYDLLSIQERRAKGLPTQLPPLQPYRKGKIAYLTFDDGPDDKNTLAVLDILKRENIKGTFYVVGMYCYAYPQNLIRIFKEGHAIGNHSYDHDYDKLYPNVNGFMEEMYRTEKAMREILGFRSMIVRAPGGTWGMFTSAYPPVLKEAGLVEHDWNVSIQDAVSTNPPASKFVEMVRQQTANGKSSAIVLMHCSAGREETVKALPAIIQLLRERGYSFGVVTPMTPQPQY